MDMTLTSDMQFKANHAYWQLFSLLSAMMSLTKGEDDDLIEAKHKAAFVQRMKAAKQAKSAQGQTKQCVPA